MSESAVAAAMAVAREQGVRCDDPVVLRDAWHVLVHLRPSPVVARVSSAIPYPVGPDPQGIVRELAIAWYAAARASTTLPLWGRATRWTPTGSTTRSSSRRCSLSTSRG